MAINNSSNLLKEGNNWDKDQLKEGDFLLLKELKFKEEINHNLKVVEASHRRWDINKISFKIEMTKTNPIKLDIISKAK